MQEEKKGEVMVVYPECRQVDLVQTPGGGVARHGALGVDGSQDGRLTDHHRPSGSTKQP